VFDEVLAPEFDVAAEEVAVSGVIVVGVVDVSHEASWYDVDV